jgi:hypothetical protein
MNNEQYIQSLMPKYEAYKKNGVLDITPEEQVKIQDIYLQIFQSKMRTHCSSCFNDDLHSLFIVTRQRLDEVEKQKELELDATMQQAILQSEIEAATIADDEQKPKRKRK